MKGFIVLALFAILNLFNPTQTHAGKDPIGWRLLFPYPPAINLNETEEIVYQFTNNLPFVMPTPLFLSLKIDDDSTGEFDLAFDLCSGKKLRPRETCIAEVILHPRTNGTKKAQLRMEYGKNVVPVPKITIQVVSGSAGSLRGWVNARHYVNASTVYPIVFFYRNVGLFPISNISTAGTGFTQTFSNCGPTLAPGATCHVEGNFLSPPSGAIRMTNTLRSSAGTLTLKWTAVVVSQPANTRAIEFINQCPFPVYYSFSGAAHGSCSAGCAAGTQCSNGTCYWVGPTNRLPPSTFALASGGGAIAFIPDYVTTGSLDQTVWAGNITAQINCTGSSCDVASCAGGPGNCTPGASYALPATLANMTLIHNNVDTYYLDLTSGVSIAMEIQPDVPPSAVNGYTCGSPGAIDVSTSNPTLNECTWRFVVPNISPTTALVWVKNQGTCTGGTCPGVPNGICGTAIQTATSLNPNACGAQLGYFSAAQQCKYTNPVGFLGCTLAVPGAGYTLSDLYNCQGNANLSCYSSASSFCCGCANWQNAIPSHPNVPATPCLGFNNTLVGSTPAWTDNPNATSQGFGFTYTYWIKQSCTTALSYKYDQPSSTFTCPAVAPTVNRTAYLIRFCPGGFTGRINNQ